MADPSARADAQQGHASCSLASDTRRLESSDSVRHPNGCALCNRYQTVLLPVRPPIRIDFAARGHQANRRRAVQSTKPIPASSSAAWLGSGTAVIVISVTSELAMNPVAPLLYTPSNLEIPEVQGEPVRFAGNEAREGRDHVARCSRVEERRLNQVRTWFKLFSERGTREPLPSILRNVRLANHLRPRLELFARVIREIRGGRSLHLEALLADVIAHLGLRPRRVQFAIDARDDVLRACWPARRARPMD